MQVIKGVKNSQCYLHITCVCWLLGLHYNSKSPLLHPLPQDQKKICWEGVVVHGSLYSLATHLPAESLPLAPTPASNRRLYKEGRSSCQGFCGLF